MNKAFAPFLLCLLVLPLQLQAASPVIISEFMADNNRILQDEDGEYSDWIELQNISTNTINLQNWSLTDDPLYLAKWRFPATNLQQGAFLVVFASGKDRKTPGSPLHTNFKLGREGEYLALVEPDGVSFASQFRPIYPPQVPDVSFGMGHDVEPLPLVTTNSVSRALVPMDDSAALLWTTPNFDDSSWLAAANGIGYEILPGEPGEDPYVGLILTDIQGLMHNQNASAYVRFPFIVDNPTSIEDLTLRMRYDDGFVAYLNGVELLRVNAPISGIIADSVAEFSGVQGEFNWYYGYYNKSADPGGLYETKDFTPFPSSPNPFGPDNYFSGASWDWYAGNPPWTELTADGGHPNGTNNGAYHWVVRRWRSEVQGSLRLNVRYAKSNVSCGNGTTGRIFHNGVQKWYYTVFANSSTGVSNSIVLTNVMVGDLIDFAIDPLGTDGQGADACDGTIFTVQIEPEVQGELTWNSSSMTTHPNAQGSQFQEFNLYGGLRWLTLGTNVLAIHGLNISATNTDFLIQGELEAAVPTSVDQYISRYFTRPTPGAANSVGVADLGPVITDVSFSPQIPSDSEDIIVTARISPAFAPLVTNKLTYRIMYNAEVTIPMFDAGTNGDLVARDGIFTARIPASASTPNQMVRWFISSSDTSNRVSRWPLYLDVNRSPQYMGTVVHDPNLTNPLPVLHWFIQTPSAADNATGTKCSLFFLGRFYDNCGINIHGQSSSGFPKKSYDVDMNPGHRFVWKEGELDVDDLNLLTTYGDKSYMRNMLAYDAYKEAGAGYHWVFPIRVQQNGIFHSVANLMENGDAGYLERLGLDQNGALYKMYNQFNSSGHTAIGINVNAEKKTRKDEGNADLVALYAGVTLTGQAQVNYVYDHIDIPSAIAFLAAHVLANDEDCCHKNYYLYCDTEGTGEWRILPWDVDLSFGHTWTDPASGGFAYYDPNIYATNRYSQTTLGIGGGNNFVNALLNNPVIHQMYRRRVRTITDEQLQPPNTPAHLLKYESMVNSLAAQIAPDAALDLARWSTWSPIQTLAQAVTDLNTNYFPLRRRWIYTTLASPGQPTDPYTTTWPYIPPQPTNVVIQFGALDFNPISGNQAEEFIQLVNTNLFPVDISDWRITGGIEHTFRRGTVMPSNTVMYVSPNVIAFRARTIGPSGGMGLFVQGNYQGQLSARGEQLDLINKAGLVVHSLKYPGAPSLAQQYLRITEIMYHPTSLAGNTNGPEEFEYLELKNIGTETLDLTGVRFRNGLTFDFAGSVVTNLAGGATVLLVKNETAFLARHGNNLAIAGQYAGNLDNAGERLTLVDAKGEEILDFSYDNNWYPITDGIGFSLVVVNENAEPDDWDKKRHWRPSGSYQGSPGATDPEPDIVQAVLINEALTRSDTPPPTDMIELFNPNTNDVYIGGWYLTDDFTTPAKFRIPTGTWLPALGFIAFNETQFNPVPGTPPSFALSADGDEVYLFSVNTNTGNLNGYYFGYEFGAAEDGISFGRYVSSDGQEDFVAQAERSFGSDNAGPKVGPIVISEIMYHPPDLGTNDNTLDEFIELLNITSNTVPLYYETWPSNTWQLTGGADYIFPTNVSLAPGEALLIVNFDPANTAQLAAFRTLYNLPINVQVFGPYGGKLNNNSDELKLMKPVRPLPTKPGVVPYVLVEKVHYRDEEPWPRAADGLGYSLQRWDCAAYGNEPTNWVSAQATAGFMLTPNPGFPRILVQPKHQTILVGRELLLNVEISGEEPLTCQWRFNATTILDATNSSLLFTNVTAEFTGDYDVIIQNSYGVVLSRRARINVRAPVAILQQPQDIMVKVAPDPGARPTNVTFNVEAFSLDALRYQWRSNGVDIPNATNASLTIMNVQTNHWANFAVLVSDDVSSQLSQTVWLYPTVRLLFLQGPVSQRVPVNGRVTLSARVSGWPPPFSFEWSRTSAAVITNVLDEGFGLFSYTAPAATVNQSVRVIVRNVGQPGGTGSPIATITTVADADADGMPDEWETLFGFSPGNPGDNLLDNDGDGFSNAQEYLAGTDPTNAVSYLRINSLSWTDNQVRIDFPAGSNKTYSVQAAASLTSSNWRTVGQLPARTTNWTALALDPTVPTNRFYRIVTPAMP